MYAKVIQKWQKKPPQDKRKWDTFSSQVVKDYKKQLEETGRTTMGQEGYDTAMHAVEKLSDGDLMTESVTEYAERATQA